MTNYAFRNKTKSLCYDIRNEANNLYILWKGEDRMEETKKTAYVDVEEVCRDWGCSGSNGYAVSTQVSQQMMEELPELLVMSGKINRIYYEEACMRR